jgi:hypothetical protein
MTTEVMEVSTEEAGFIMELRCLKAALPADATVIPLAAYGEAAFVSFVRRLVDTTHNIAEASYPGEMAGMVVKVHEDRARRKAQHYAALQWVQSVFGPFSHDHTTETSPEFPQLDERQVLN